MYPSTYYYLADSVESSKAEKQATSALDGLHILDVVEAHRSPVIDDDDDDESWRTESAVREQTNGRARDIQSTLEEGFRVPS